MDYILLAKSLYIRQTVPLEDTDVLPIDFIFVLFSGQIYVLQNSLHNRSELQVWTDTRSSYCGYGALSRLLS